MGYKVNNKKLKKITLTAMYSFIAVQIVLFRALDITSKPESLVNYVVTFIILCMTAILAQYYLQTLPDGTMPNMYYYSILAVLFLYSFAITVSFSFPTEGKYITAQMAARTIVYQLGLMLGLAFGMYFISFYKTSESGKRKRRIAMLAVYALFALLVLTNPKTQLLFYFRPDGSMVYPKTYVLINFCPAMLFVYHLYETLRSDNDRNTKRALLSYCFFALFFVVIDSLPFDSSNIRIDSGIALGSLLSTYTIFLEILVQDKIELSRKKAELREKQTQIMVSQIQPHFLYNTLSAIYVLCGEDPKLAQKTIKDFSAYLRQNMNSLNSKDCVPFEKELDHTRTYLTIEKLRFEDLLRVEYDIQYSDFMLPPLTLQPIVENAVKYGIRGREDGGTVQIQTRKKNNKIYIRVKDDGNGFDPAAVQDDGKTHIGLANTRRRIESMCGGQMVIESSAETGTSVTIILEEKQ